MKSLREAKRKKKVSSTEKSLKPRNAKNNKAKKMESKKK
jgi:hypothetical protein